MLCFVLEEERGRCLEDNSVAGQPRGWCSLATTQLLEMTVLVSVTC